MGEHCQLKTCPEDCNDQGRCKDGQCVCFPGYFGIDCGSKSCPNNCQNHGRCEKGVCICDSGYSGVDCSSRTCPKNCFNRGRCKNGVCICDPDYTGLDCSMKTCLNDCQDHGRCEDGMCVCYPGFTGVDCSSRTCLNDCQNNGRCEDGVCVCDSGFSGPDCGFMSCPEDCNEQGRCVSGVCICDSGFIGPDCGTRVCSPECERRGRCEDGECICNPGFTGPDCEIKTCPNDCHKQGMCVDGKCVCDSEYTGLDCQFKSCPNKCHNRGRCEDGICICNSGYSGSDCGSKTCPKNCSGNGQCVKGKCICDPGFIGPVCGTRACSAGCSNHGRCVRGICVCSPGYTGVDCASRLCPKNCNNRGRCENGVCICDPEYTGLDCGSRNCPNNCNSKGQCDDGVCICDLGYTGLDCATKSCFNDCHHRGRCVDGVCICEAGYTGLDCGTLSCPEDCHNRGQCENGVCVCDPGFTGLDCGSRSCPNNCNYRGQCEDGECICDSGYTDHDCGSKTCPNNCQNHGRCDNGECICDSGYAGTDCGLRPCPNNCHNQGQCVDGVCICNSGYTDLDCGLKTCPYDCHDRGQCVNGICICDSGYSGLDCGSASCPNNCQNHGKCDNGECVCDSGYTGVDCGTQACPENCHIHGRCEQGVCICQPGYTGLDCSSKSCPKNCNGNGQCINGKCNCDFGFAGPVCGSRTCPGNCGGRGKCINGVCMCKKGYEGADCSMVVTELVAVTGLHVTSVEESSVTIEWDLPQTPPDLYVISFKAKKENGLLNNTVDGSLTSFVQTGLASGEEYLVSIQPQKGLSVGPDTTVTATTSIETPQGLRVTEITTTSFLLRWERPQSFPDRYIVTLVSPSGKEKKLKAPGKGDRVRVTGLEEGTIYKVILRAERGQEQSRGMETTANTAIDRERKNIDDEEARKKKGKVVTPQRVGQLEKPRFSEDHYGTATTGQVHTGGGEGSSKTREITEYIAEDQTQKGILNTTRRTIKTTIITTYHIQNQKEGGVVDIFDDTKDIKYSQQRTKHLTDREKISSELEEGDLGEITEKTDTTRADVKKLVPESKVQSWITRGKIIDASSGERPPIRLIQESNITSVNLDNTQGAGRVGFSQTDPMRQKTSDQSVEVVTGIKVNLESTESKTFSHDKLPFTINEKLKKERGSGGAPDNRYEMSASQEYSDISTKAHAEGRNSRKDNIGWEEEKLFNQTVEEKSGKRRLEAGIKDQKQNKMEKAFSGGLHIKAVIENLPTKLSVYNGTFIQRLESYLRSTSYPLRINQTVESVARAIFLYLVKYKPNSFTGMVYDRLPEKTPGAPGNMDPFGASRLQGNMGSVMVGNKSDQTKEVEVLKPKDRSEYSSSSDLHEVNMKLLREDLLKAKITHMDIEDVQVENPTPTNDKEITPQTQHYHSKKIPPKQLRPENERSEIKEGEIKNEHHISRSKIDDRVSLPQVREGEGKENKEKATIFNHTHGFAGRSPHPTLIKISGPGIYDRPTILQSTPTSLVVSLDGIGVLSDKVMIHYRPFQTIMTDIPHQMEVGKGVGKVVIRDLEPGTTYRLDIHGLLRGQSSKSYTLIADTAQRSTKLPTVVTTQPTISQKEDIITTTTLSVSPRPRVPAQMGALQVRNVTSESITLVWKAKIRVYDSFLVRYEEVTEGVSPQEISVPGDQREVTLRGLTQDTRYAVLLYGIKGGKLSRPLREEVTTEPLPDRGTPPRLSPLLVSEVHTNSALLSWEPLDGDFDAYILRYGPPEGPMQEETLRGDQTSFLIDGLVAGVNYSVELLGIWGESYTEPQVTNVLTEKPQPPRLESLTLSDVRSESLHLSWDVQGGEFDSFLLLYRDGEGKPQEITLDKNLRSFTIIDLKPGKKYKFVLYGMSGEKRSKPVSAEGSTEKLQPPRLESLSVSDVHSDSVLLSWVVQGGKFDSFLLNYRDAEGKPKEVAFEGEQRSVPVGELKPGKKYKFILYGISGGKKSKAVIAEATTKPLPEKGTLPRLSPLLVSEVHTNSALLSWQALDGNFDAYILRYGPPGGPMQEETLRGDQTSFLIDELVAAVNYSVELLGIWGERYTAPQVTSVLTEPLPEKGTLPRLSPLLVSEVHTNSALLSWQALDGNFDAYILRYGPPGGPMQEETLRGDQTSFLIDELVAAVNYSVELLGIWGERYTAPQVTSVLTEKRQPPRLEYLTLSDVRSESLHLSWDVQGGEFDSFLLLYRDGEGKPQEKTVDKELRAFTVRDLKPGKKYKFVLYGMSGEKRSKPVSAEGGTEKLQPPQLESLSVSDVHSHSVLLSWVVQGGKFDSFLLNYRDAEGKPKEVALEGEQRSVPVGELKPGKKYKFVLYGISGGKKSKAAIAETTTKPHEKLVPSSPATPTMPRLIDLQANEIGKDSVNLSWKVEGESSFDWIVVQYGEPDGRVREEQVPGGDTSTTVTGLLPSRRYKFNLYGIKGERRSKPLSIEIETDFLEAIGQPTSFLNDLYVSPRGPHSILLSWEAPEGFDSFVINYSIEGHEKPQKKASVDGTARTLLLTDLQPDTLYKVILHGIRKGKEQNSLKATGRTGSLDLEPPKNLRFNDVEETSFTVIWDPPNPETTTFKVSYQLAKGGEPESVSVVGDSKSLQRLNSGTHYEVTVVSVRGFEESQPLTGYITTGGGGPRSLRALDVTEESALLRWEPEMGSVDRYLVTYRAENVLSVTLEVSSDQTELPITGLNPHTEYYASVQSLHGSKLSSPTSTSFTTGADTPRELLANKITAHSALLTWKPPQAVPDAYRLIYQTQDGEMKEFILPANMSSFTLSHLTPSTPYKVQLHALRGASSSAPISTSFTTGRIRFPFPQNCWEKLMNGEVQSGLFTIYMGGSKDDPLLVYCDMETDGGGWIVFQRRMDGKTNFWRDWNEYKMGFGNFTSEFWLGNTALHRLSSLAPYELRVDLRAGAESAHAVYEDFRIEPEDKHFRLRIGEYRGTAGDSLSYHNNMIFSTRDRDAQKRILPCAISYRGAWWYKNCHYANLNGIYGNNKDHQGMNWYTWKGFEFSIPFTEMKMRPQRAGNWRRL
ncbi:tenascin-X isoform X1 [Xenopus laevis]|nr:tenascin-X isoform X1 [Xenopus laevis]